MVLKLGYVLDYNQFLIFLVLQDYKYFGCEDILIQFEVKL